MGNTVGSLEIPTLLRARKNLALEITDRQRDILIGCALGDAYIRPQGKIRVEQSTHQKEYLWWKYKELQSLAYPALPREIARTHSKTGREYSSIFFEIRQYFREWRQIFYDGKRKVFPPNLLLQPLSVAVWYMDDGCWTGKKILISTESFDDESIARIQNLFRSQFKIETVVGKNRKLVIRKQSHGIFCALISPFIISSMKRKIPNPVTTSL